MLIHRTPTSGTRPIWTLALHWLLSSSGVKNKRLKSFQFPKSDGKGRAVQLVEKKSKGNKIKNNSCRDFYCNKVDLLSFGKNTNN